MSIYIYICIRLRTEGLGLRAFDPQMSDLELPTPRLTSGSG